MDAPVVSEDCYLQPHEPFRVFRVAAEPRRTDGDGCEPRTKDEMPLLTRPYARRHTACRNELAVPRPGQKEICEA